MDYEFVKNGLWVRDTSCCRDIAVKKGGGDKDNDETSKMTSNAKQTGASINDTMRTRHPGY